MSAVGFLQTADELFPPYVTAALCEVTGAASITMVVAGVGPVGAWNRVPVFNTSTSLFMEPGLAFVETA